MKKIEIVWTPTRADRVERGLEHLISEVYIFMNQQSLDKYKLAIDRLQEQGYFIKEHDKRTYNAHIELYHELGHEYGLEHPYAEVEE